jgi:hypothetical protein
MYLNNTYNTLILGDIPFKATTQTLSSKLIGRNSTLGTGIKGEDSPLEKTHNNKTRRKHTGKHDIIPYYSK